MLVEDRWGMPRVADPDRPEACTAFGAGDQWQLGDNPVVGLLRNAQEHERQIIGAPYINDDSTYTLRPDNPRTMPSMTAWIPPSFWRICSPSCAISI